MPGFTYTPTFVRRSTKTPALTVGVRVSNGSRVFNCELLMIPRGSDRWSYSWSSDETASASRAGVNSLDLVRVARDAAEKYQRESAIRA